MVINGKLNYSKVKETREEKDITIKKISDDLGLDIEILKSIESGQVLPSKEVIAKLSTYLGLNIDEIYDENFKNTRVLTFLNNKGGSGKTSVSGSVAYALSEQGRKVLCIDADMQGNLTHSFNLECDEEKNLYKALLQEADLTNYIIPSGYENIDFITYSAGLSAIEMIMFTKNAREGILSRMIENVIGSGIYDYILIDTNPTLSILNLNTVGVAHYVIPPVYLGSFGLEGLSYLLDFVDGAAKFNPNFKDIMFVINNYDKRKGISLKLRKWLEENYPEHLFKTIVNIDTAIEQAQLEGKPVLEYKPNSRISCDVRSLTKEILNLD